MVKLWSGIFGFWLKVFRGVFELNGGWCVGVVNVDEGRGFWVWGILLS